MSQEGSATLHETWVCGCCSGGGHCSSFAHGEFLLRSLGFCLHGPLWWLCYSKLEGPGQVTPKYWGRTSRSRQSLKLFICSLTKHLPCKRSLYRSCFSSHVGCKACWWHGLSIYPGLSVGGCERWGLRPFLRPPCQDFRPSNWCGEVCGGS